MKLKNYGPTEHKVKSLVEPIVAQFGLNLWNVSYEKDGASWYLRVIIDKEDGIDISDCENVTRPLNEILDEVEPIPQMYYLEVGSAGVNRKLLREEHFTASVGKKVKVHLIRPNEQGERDFSGTLEEFTQKTVTVNTGDESLCFELAGVASVCLDDFDDMGADFAE